MGAIPALFAEYDSRDAEGNVLDLSQRKTEYDGRGPNNPPKGSCRATITKEEADGYVYERIIPGDDGWDPRTMMEKLPAPRKLKKQGLKVSWKNVSAAAGYVIWALLMKNNPVSRIAVFGLIIPIMNVLLSAILNGEPLFEWQYLAALVLVCGGIYLVNRPAAGKKKEN